MTVKMSHRTPCIYCELFTANYIYEINEGIKNKMAVCSDACLNNILDSTRMNICSTKCNVNDCYDLFLFLARGKDHLKSLTGKCRKCTTMHNIRLSSHIISYYNNGLKSNPHRDGIDPPAYQLIKPQAS